MRRVVYTGNSSYFLGTMKRVALQTLGCKVNYAETATIGRQFHDRGFRVVSAEDHCDVFVLNTCSVTERADRECRQLIRRVLRHSPYAYVVVLGCYAQLRPEEIAAIEGVDLVLGTQDKFRILDRAGEFVKSGLPQIFVSCIDETEEFVPSSSGDIDNRTRAFLKIQDGCDYACSFCTIPQARGASRSQPSDGILAQARTLIDSGYKEIVLTGINVGDYGRTIGTDLFTLLRSFNDLKDLRRLRISSIEPNLVTEPMIDFLLESDMFCNHFHIPLQSGSATLLARMRRRYRKDDYARIVDYINRRDPQAAIGADVLVGFPGETESLFQETVDFLEDLPLTYLHVFSYSERPGTPAASADETVEPRRRAERSETLRILGSHKRSRFIQASVGSLQEVLFESRAQNGLATGLTRNYIRADVDVPEPIDNKVLSVRIDSAEADRARATLVNAIQVGERKRSSFSTMISIQ